MGLFGTLLYLTLLIIQPHEFLPFFQTKWVAWIVPLTLLAGVVETWGQSRKEGAYWLSPHTFLLIFLLFVFGSNGLNGNLENGWQQLILYLKRTAVYLMIFFTLNTATRLKTALVWLILLITVLAVAGIDQGLTGIGWAGQPLAEGRIRWVGDWDGSNGLCLLFVLAAVLSFEFGFGPYAQGSKVLFLVALSCLLPGIYFTNSRGGWLSLCFVILLFLMERLRKYFFRMLLGATLAISLLIAVSPSRISEINTKEEAAHERLWSWEQGLRFLQGHPFYGIGKGMYAQRADGGLLAHNNYIQVAAEVGWIGYFVWLTISYLALKGCFWVMQQHVLTPDHALVIGLARGMLMAMIAFSAVTFFITMELDILFVLWGLCAAVIREGLQIFPALSSAYRLRRRDFLIIVGGGIGILGLLYILVG